MGALRPESLGQSAPHTEPRSRSGGEHRPQRGTAARGARGRRAVLDPGQIGNLDIRLEEARNRLEKLEGKTEQLPLIRMSGFFQVDDGLFSHSPSSQAYYGDIQDGVGFRRAPLSAVGKLTEFTNFSIEFDFAQIGRPSFFIWGEQEQIPILGTVRIGQFRRARDPPGSKKDDDVKSKDPKADAKKKEAPPPVGRCDQCGGCEGVRKVCVAKMIEKEISLLSRICGGLPTRVDVSSENNWGVRFFERFLSRPPCWRFFASHKQS